MSSSPTSNSGDHSRVGFRGRGPALVAEQRRQSCALPPRIGSCTTARSGRRVKARNAQSSAAA